MIVDDLDLKTLIAPTRGAGWNRLFKVAQNDGRGFCQAITGRTNILHSELLLPNLAERFGERQAHDGANLAVAPLANFRFLGIGDQAYHRRQNEDYRRARALDLGPEARERKARIEGYGRTALKRSYNHSAGTDMEERTGGP